MAQAVIDDVQFLKAQDDALEDVNRWDLFLESNSGFNVKSEEPHTLEIAYSPIKGKTVHEVVFEDPAEVDKRPRLLVSLQSVLALKSLCEREFDRVEVITELLKCCRTAYYKELCYLREQLTLAMRPQGQAGMEEHVHSYEVYWYDPPEYIDADMKAFLQDCIRLTNKKLIEENFELLNRIKQMQESAGGQGSGVVMSEEAMIQKLLQKLGPGGIVRKIHTSIKEIGNEKQMMDFTKAMKDIMEPPVEDDDVVEKEDDNPHSDKAVLRKLRKELEDWRKKQKDFDDLRRRYGQLELQLEEAQKNKGTGAAILQARVDEAQERAESEAARAEALSAQVEQMKQQVSVMEEQRSNVKKSSERLHSRLSVVASKMNPERANTPGKPGGAGGAGGLGGLGGRGGRSDLGGIGGMGAEAEEPLASVEQATAEIESALHSFINGKKPMAKTDDESGKKIEQLEEKIREAVKREARYKVDIERLKEKLEAALNPPKVDEEEKVEEESPEVIKLRKDIAAIKEAIAEASKREEKLKEEIAQTDKKFQRLKDSYKDFVPRKLVDEAEAISDELTQRLQRAQDKIYSLKDEVKKWKMLAGGSAEDSDDDSDDSDIFGDIPKFLLSYVKRNRHSLKPRWQQLSEDAKCARQKREFLWGQRHNPAEVIEELGDAANAAFQFLRDQEIKEQSRRVSNGGPIERRRSTKLHVRSHSVVLADEREALARAEDFARMVRGNGGSFPFDSTGESEFTCQKCGALNNILSRGPDAHHGDASQRASMESASGLAPEVVNAFRGMSYASDGRKSQAAPGTFHDPRVSYVQAHWPAGPVAAVGPGAPRRTLNEIQARQGSRPGSRPSSRSDKGSRPGSPVSFRDRVSVMNMPPERHSFGLGHDLSGGGPHSQPPVTMTTMASRLSEAHAQGATLLQQGQAPLSRATLLQQGQAPLSRASALHQGQAQAALSRPVDKNAHPGERQASDAKKRMSSAKAGNPPWPNESSNHPWSGPSDHTQHELAQIGRMSQVQQNIEPSMQAARESRSLLTRSSHHSSDLSLLTGSSGQQQRGRSEEPAASPQRRQGPSSRSNSAKDAPKVHASSPVAGRSRSPDLSKVGVVYAGGYGGGRYVKAGSKPQKAEVNPELLATLTIVGSIRPGDEAAPSLPPELLQKFAAEQQARHQPDTQLDRAVSASAPTPGSTLAEHLKNLADQGSTLRHMAPSEAADIIHRRKLSMPNGAEMVNHIRYGGMMPMEVPTEWAVDSRKRAPTPTRIQHDVSGNMNPPAAEKWRPRSRGEDSIDRSQSLSRSQPVSARSRPPSRPPSRNQGLDVSPSARSLVQDTTSPDRSVKAQRASPTGEVRYGPTLTALVDRQENVAGEATPGNVEQEDAIRELEGTASTKHKAKGSNKPRTADMLPMEASVDSVATMLSTTAPSTTSRESGGRSATSDGLLAASMSSSRSSGWRKTGSRKQPKGQEPTPPAPPTSMVRSPLSRSDGFQLGYGTYGSEHDPKRTLGHGVSSPLSAAFHPPLGLGGAEGRSPPARSATAQVRRSISSAQEAPLAASSPKQRHAHTAGGGLRERDVNVGHSRSTGSLPLTNVARERLGGGRGGSGSPVKQRRGGAPGAAPFTESEARAAVAAASNEGVLPEVLPALPPGKIRKGVQSAMSWVVV